MSVDVLEKYSRRFTSTFGDNQAHRSADFRSDISGLRALAVLLVLLSHYQIAGFSAGFVGVDIFFVISGYLITGLLAAEYERNSNSENGLGWISIGAFYMRRARRILPAALFVLIVTVVVAYLTLNVLAARQVAVDSTWAALFASNINFMHQATDYWAQGQSVSPVLHYWSLAVEEQFYFVWPLLFVAATSLHGFVVRGRTVSWVHRLLFAVTLMTLVSFAWMVVSFRTEPNAAYFSSLTRAWELGVGAIAVLSLRLIRGRNLGSPSTWAGVGLTLIVVSMFVVNSANFGYSLVLPVVGAALLLLAGSPHFSGGRENAVSRGLSVKPMVMIGAISYSLYLWHWPVLILGRHLGFFESGPSVFLAVAISFLLAAASYRFIELPFLRIRIPNQVSDSRVAGPISIVLCAAVLAALSYVTSTQSLSGLQTSAGSAFVTTPIAQASAPADAAELTYAEQLSAWQTKIAAGLKTRSLGGRAASEFGNLGSQWVNFPYNWKAPNEQHKAFIMGDSMSERANGILFQTLDPQTWSIMTRRVGPAADITYFPGSGWPVEQQQAALGEMAREKPDLVVLIDGRNSLYGNSPQVSDPTGQSFRAWASIVKKLRAISKQVVVLGVIPTLPKQIVDCVSRDLIIDATCRGDVGKFNNAEAMERKAVTQAGGIYLSTADWLCLNGKCPPVIGDDLVYLDGLHWSNAIIKGLAPLFKSELVSLDQWPGRGPS